MDHMAFDLLPRSIGDASPATHRTRAQDHATLLVSWWCTIFALVIILTRVCGRYIRTERFFNEDRIIALSIIPLMIRMALVHVVLLYGTNNTTLLQSLTPLEVHQRSIGSQLVLASRIFYAMFIWTAKWAVSEFLKRINTSSWNRKREMGLKIIRGFLVVTFIAVVIGTLAECQPFSHYWQVIPDPGPKCRNGYAQLLTMGISDIITDVLLIVFPMPIIISSGMPVMRKISLCSLFALSFILLAIAAYRMPAIIAVHGSQQRRTLWASIEILAAAAVANSVVIGSFVRDRGVKKAKWRPDECERVNSAGNPSINRTLTQQHWGNDSDHDLFRSLGCRLNSVAEQGGSQPIARAAPPVEPHPQTEISNYSSSHEKSAWGQQIQDMSISDTSSDLKDASLGGPHFLSDGGHVSQQLALYDIGGILEDGPEEYTPRATGSPGESIDAQDFALAPRTGVGHGRTSSEWPLTSTVMGASQAQTSSATQETAPSSTRYSGNRRVQQSQPPSHLQAGISNGRPAESDSLMELNDAGGLLS